MFQCDKDSDNMSVSDDSDSDHTDNDNSDLKFEGDYSTELRIMRAKVNWENEKERRKFFRRLHRLVKNWEGNLPDLRDIFRPEEIDWLLIEDVEKNWFKSDKKYSVIEFVIRSGYEDEPKLDEDGKPLLCRPTAVHHAGFDHVASLYDPELIRKLFEIYSKFNFNYANKHGFTHFHAACIAGCNGVVAQFLVLGQDPNCLPQKPSRTWVDPPLHFAVERGRVKLVELLLRAGADPNLANRDGSTALHIICQNSDIEPAKRSFEMSSENTSPLYTSEQRRRKNFELLLRSGADPNIANDEGSTPLHVIAKTSCDSDSMMKFFKMCDDNRLQVQVDVRDKLGRTPLQWAVANCLPRSVDLLLDRGADLSSFVFPTADRFAEATSRRCEIRHFEKFPIKIASDAMAIVDHLEKRGYKLNRADALAIVKTFDDYGLIDRLDTSWPDDQQFEEKAKTIIVKDKDPKLSLYDLIQLQPREAEKLFTYADYSKLADSKEWSRFPDRRVCCTRLAELTTRGFCRRWALESFMEMTRNKFPISWCENFIDPLASKELYYVCLQASEYN
ncbi:hypothetical protein TKK_0013216 [Trichogramma kaykai]